ncbi:MAG: hypothetical protein U1E22_09605, partial [Coriobacteriia bacterium]|nr:hypothetical protein [Coriobacteriia bacterium]
PASTTDPFVLVVEGAVQVSSAGGAWDKTGAAPWCSIGMAEDPASHGEHEFDDVVATLAGRPDCLATIAIGQCACFGGYPGCVSPEFGESQSPAYGVHDFLTSTLNSLTPDERTRAGNRVVNVPGCPTNPWWFVLTVVLWVAEAANGPLKSTPVAGPLGILGSDFAVVGGVDSQRRLKAVYGPSIHGPSCPRYKYAFPNWNGPGTAAKYASYPGDIGCLALIGCKGNSTNSLCALHGWNAQQPHNNTAWDQGLAQIQGSIQGGFCVAGGYPCMGCTEKGYPDAYVPFITQR